MQLTRTTSKQLVFPDNYDEAKLNLNKADIKAYDSVTGAEVTDKFDITVNNGVITANLKAGFTKSLWRCRKHTSDRYN